jgi:hypothetical protein
MLASAAEMRPDVPETVRLALQEITDQAEDISVAVRQFLDDAKQGVDGLGDPRPMNVAALAQEGVERWRATFQGAIDYAAADDPLHVTIDPVLFRRALGNILSNATRAADVGGHVAVTVRKFQTERGARAVIEVDDSGPGFGNIPSGHGLGLAVVRRTVEAAGGSVEFDEGTLGGALVRMVLPVTVKQASLADELAASFQGEIPLSALADIAMDLDEGEEIADGHVLATRFAALPEQLQLPAAPARAPFDSYATPVWAVSAPAEITLAAPAAKFDVFRASVNSATAGTVQIDLAALTGCAPAAKPSVFGAPVNAAFSGTSEIDLAALPAPHAADRLPDVAAQTSTAASTDAGTAESAEQNSATPSAPAPAQHATRLQLPSRTSLTMPPRIPVPTGVPQVATQLSLLPGGAF